ncbi:hypothetical protein Zm00014a_015820 [Zea mays]|uniref:Uncharacterized protein n=1 Tax=Zea mays TaxID=4577 RepID=A0A3L6F5U9_MAIZE|nr:hypothetical protein Zm00014a_015820 [Zea mays]
MSAKAFAVVLAVGGGGISGCFMKLSSLDIYDTRLIGSRMRGKHVGGCTDTVKLYRKGELASMLSGLDININNS